MAFLGRFQKVLGGGEALRPIDYLVLMSIVMILVVRIWSH